ncbi:hypothetical protein GEMRC1_002650 [Eukaryota sp. GEM-RC1]
MTVQEQPQQPPPPPFKFNKKYIILAVFLFSIFKMFIPVGSHTPYDSGVPYIAPAYPIGSNLSLSLYASLSSSPKFDRQKAQLVYESDSFTLTNPLTTINESISYSLPEQVITKNATLYAHLILSDTSSSKPKRAHLFGSGQSDNVTVISKQKSPHVLREVVFGIVPDGKFYKKTSVPPAYQGKLKLSPTGSHYFPFVFFHDFWVLPEFADPAINLNQSNLIETRLVMTDIALWKVGIYTGVEQQISMQQQMGLGELMGDTGDMLSEVKRMLLNTAPWLMISTVIVSVGHMITEMLAMKSELHFWKGKRDFKGLSVRSVLFNTVMQTVITLYLIDNETSAVVLITSVLGVGLEWWKVFKCFSFTFITVKGVRIPFLTPKGKSSLEKETSKYDSIAMRGVLYVLMPVCLGYSIYAFFYHSYKSLYSWLITSLVNICWSFSFAAMIPQVYINYKLKSVAAINYKTLSYKFFSTIIDDFGVFIIKTPVLYRIAAFRDDVVFVILMAQRFMYPVDKNRIEGVSGVQQAADIEKQD